MVNTYFFVTEKSDEKIHTTKRTRLCVIHLVKVLVFYFALISISISFAACGDVSIQNRKLPLGITENNSESIHSTNESQAEPKIQYEFELPEDIEIKCFDINVYSKTYTGWTNYFAILTDSAYMVYDFFLGDTYVINVDKAGGVYPTEHVIKYNDPSGLMQNDDIAIIMYDKEGLVKEINVTNTSNKNFSVTGLQVGENAREYLNSISDGLWDKLMAMEEYLVINGAGGINLWHNTQTFAAGILEESEVNFNYINFGNDKISLSYKLNGEIVDSINVYTKNDSIREELRTELYDIEMPDYYVDGLDLLAAKQDEWITHFQIPYDEDAGYLPCLSDDLYVEFRENGESFWAILVAKKEVTWAYSLKDQIPYPIMDYDESDVYCIVNGKPNGSSYEIEIYFYPLISESSRFSYDNLGFGDNFMTFLNSYDSTAQSRLMETGEIKSGVFTISLSEYEGTYYAGIHREAYGNTYKSSIYDYFVALDENNNIKAINLQIRR